MSKPALELTLWDRIVGWFSPAAGLRRLQARAAAGLYTRNYDAASPSRRTNNWPRKHGDANTVTQSAVAELRVQARDLVRNNAWAKNAQRKIVNNTVGWGIVPKAAAVKADASLNVEVNSEAARLWKLWADTTECESEGRHTFYGLQAQVMRSLSTDGEVLIRRRWRKTSDGLTVPMQLQILESDFLDTGLNEDVAGRYRIVQGVEFDMLGRRVAYWLFPEHPGSATRLGSESRRVPAEDIAHVFGSERPGQVRGVSWFGSAIVNLRDFDEFEDAELLRQKIAACFAGFVYDADGAGTQLGAEDTATPPDPTIETIEPGQVQYLKDGQKIEFSTPPATSADGFTTRTLRRVGAGLGLSYEDLTGDYERVSFSSARMARLSHQGNVRDWQYNLLIPLFCGAVWRWFVEAAQQSGALPREVKIPADWTVPPLPMIEPDKEGLAYSRLIRNGIMTHDDAIREQGGDPEQHWAEYKAGIDRLREMDLMLDSDASKTSQAGLTQARAGIDGAGAPPTKDPPTVEEKKSEKAKRAALLAELLALET